MSIFDSDLMNAQTETCVFLNKATVSDGYGGYKTAWTEGAEFEAVIIEDTSRDATVAGLEQSTDFWGVKVRNYVPLEYLSVFKRLSDGKVFRIRKQGMEAPRISAMEFKTLSAESYTPTED